MGKLTTPVVIERSNGHEWAEWVFTSRTMICCNRCGLVRRADGTSNPCKGRVRVALRGRKALSEHSDA